MNNPLLNKIYQARQRPGLMPGLLLIFLLLLVPLSGPVAAQEPPAADAEAAAETATSPVPLQAALRFQTVNGRIRSTNGTLIRRAASTVSFQPANASSANAIPIASIQEVIIREPELFGQMDEHLVRDDDAAASANLARAIRTLAPYTPIRGSNAGDLIGQAVQVFLSRDKSAAALAGLEQAGITSETTKPGTAFARMQALLYAANGDPDTAERLLTDPEEQAEDGQTGAGEGPDAGAEQAQLRRAGVDELEELARGRIALAREDTTAALNHFARVQVLSIPSNPWFAPAMFYSATCYRDLEVPAPAETPNAPAPPQQILRQMQRLFPDSAWTERLQRETGLQM